MKSNNGDYNFSATLTELAIHAENEESWGNVSHSAQKSPSLRTPVGTNGGGFHAAIKK